jgi:hypothetical protein
MQKSLWTRQIEADQRKADENRRKEDERKAKNAQ